MYSVSWKIKSRTSRRGMTPSVHRGCIIETYAKWALLEGTEGGRKYTS